MRRTFMQAYQDVLLRKELERMMVEMELQRRLPPMAGGRVTWIDRLKWWWQQHR